MIDSTCVYSLCAGMPFLVADARLPRKRLPGELTESLVASGRCGRSSWGVFELECRGCFDIGASFRGNAVTTAAKCRLIVSFPAMGSLGQTHRQPEVSTLRLSAKGPAGQKLKCGIQAGRNSRTHGGIKQGEL